MRLIAPLVLVLAAITPAFCEDPSAIAARIRSGLAKVPHDPALLDRIALDSQTLLDLIPQNAATEAIARKGLGYVAMQRDQPELAEKQLTRSLELDARDGEISALLATLTKRYKKPGWQSLALFHYVRAATYTGPGALPEDSRKNILEFARKGYELSFGKNEEGFRTLVAATTDRALPPPGFTIEK